MIKMLFTLFELFMIIINTILSISLMTILYDYNNNVQDEELTKELNTISTLISYKLNKMAMLKEEVESSPYNYEIKSFVLPSTVGGYTYTIKFINKGDFDEIDLSIEDLGINIKSYVFKKGCSILYNNKENFEINSRNIKFMKATIVKDGECKIYISVT